MKRIALGCFVLCAACGGSPSEPATPAAESATPVATPAPEKSPAASEEDGLDFTLTDVDGKSHTLSEYRGKAVVLEWFNPQCPFVKYAYNEGKMASLAANQLGKGDIVWLAINSGAAGKQGHGLELNKSARDNWGMKQAVLLDENGVVGKKFGAKSTPHIFVLDPQGRIAYKGALDNKPLGKGEGAYQNYLLRALASLRDGTPMKVSETASYGCSVKY